MSDLSIYNSLTRQKERFEPIEPGKVSLYVCGITVYDFCHLGHARSMVCFDVIVRYLRSIGYDVNYVRNITDIDDKIIKRAQEKKIPISELTDFFINEMHNDCASLNITPPTHEPKATEYIGEIITLVERLIEKNMAYVSGSGDVCFQVERFEGYGKLSHKDIDGQASGVRVDVDAGKRSPHDFVLWKMSKDNEPSWPSPWGAGRPGWHIECSAMAMKNLGEQFDIHGGGFDLQFPHHENEIAQSEGATGKTYANVWMHVGMLQVNQEKMSKSLGNFFTIQDVLKNYSPEIIRYFLLSSHYRSQLNFSTDNLLASQKGLERLYLVLRDHVIDSQCDLSSEWLDKFNEAMNDDFNTPEALAVMFQLSHEVNKTGSASLAATLKHLGQILGILQDNPEQFLQSGLDDTAHQSIDKQIAARAAARANKNWLEADRIRDELLAQGIELEDKTTGTVWRKISH